MIQAETKYDTHLLNLREIDMLRRDEKIKSNTKEQQLFISMLALALTLFAGCATAPVKNWDCTYPDDDGKWSCSSLHSDRHFHCQDDAYVIEEAQ